MTNSTTSRLHTTVDALRTALADSPDLLSFTLGGTIDGPTATAALAEGVPGAFVDFCRVLDGASCGPSVQLFGLAEARSHQFYCTPIVDSPLNLSPEKLYCIGVLHDTPIHLDRATGTVLGIPDEHWEWPDAERFDELASGVTEFFLERLAVPGYQQLALVDDELAEYDGWLTLLRRAGIV
ncbi:hypothetical protein [Streptomyces acidiscabies]|uniref:hypothetical protein n=1 Tax=Streptomyces acidiscabies TaxID=42234 RepID=UPI00099C9E8F|nr:hypothetical protein [Streptomyces acidiscabies]